MKDQIFLGIETSCDETAAAVVKNGRQLLSNQVMSQIKVHQEFGGVVPEVAARGHLQTINTVVECALKEAQIDKSDLTGIACTSGPGLIGTLLVGMSAAKSLSWSWDVPLFAVDHLLAHVCANYIDTDLEPPFVALLVSGGHTQIIYFQDYKQGQILGQTRDDAAGEAYDKVARLLGLPYPGGPAIDKIAGQGNNKAFKFPEGLVPGYDFSFSGLKTAVLRTIEKLKSESAELPQADLAASFQEAVVSVLVKKTLQAAQNYSAQKVVLAGGVAANRALRARFAEQSPVPVYYPKLSLCTDNAAMVACAAYFCGVPSGYDLPVYSRQLKP